MHKQRVTFSIFVKIFLTTFFFSAVPMVGLVAFVVFGYERAVDLLFGSIPPTDDVRVFEAYRSIALLRLKMIGLVFLLYTAMVAGSLLASMLLVRPISRLLHGIEKVTEGDLKVRVRPSGHDEITRLTETFNRMVEWLMIVKTKKEMFHRLKAEAFSLTLHYIRTLFSKTKWSLNIILDRDAGAVTPKQEALIRESLVAEGKLSEAFLELMALSEIETGAAYNFQESQLEEILGEEFETLKPAALKNQLTFDIHFPGEKTPKVFVDRERIRSVVFRLLENAITYTSAGGAITLALEQDSEKLSVLVKDTGIGIPPHELPFIFTRFFRGKKAVELGKAGMGIELYIAKYIVLRHGGEITVESQEGKGSKFQFTIPLDRSRIPASEEHILESLSW